MHNLSRLSTIGIDLCQDVWSYISQNYLTQKINKSEVGSSTMPHKVNPIDFENAEGNFGLTRALTQHLADKLPVSRLQRDLSDSTTLRNIGSVVGYHQVALTSLRKGLSKVHANQHVIARDLGTQWQLLAEPIQTLLRKEGHLDSYELLKDATRGSTWSKQDYSNFVKSLEGLLPERDIKTLLALSPSTYTGVASIMSE